MEAGRRRGAVAVDDGEGHGRTQQWLPAIRSGFDAGDLPHAMSAAPWTRGSACADRLADLLIDPLRCRD